jgi:hypothetical protein
MSSWLSCRSYNPCLSPSACGDYARTLDYVLHPASNSFRGFQRTHRSLKVNGTRQALRQMEDSAGPNANHCRKLPVESFCIQFSTYFMAFAGAMRLSGLKKITLPWFRKIYQKHFDDARFDTTLRLEPRFESQKLRLLSVRYLLEKNQHLDPDACADLIRTTLVEGNFRRAQQTFHR